MTGDDDLVTERRGAVPVLRLNRPEARNALTPSLIDRLGRAVTAAESDAEVRALVLTGTGDRAFCAGMDLRSFAAGDAVDTDGPGYAGFRRLLAGEVGIPVVGAANATALAGGLELLLGCDIVVLAEGAEVGLPEVRRGLVAGGGGTTIGTRVPLACALELTLTGAPIDAARAVAIGLANAAVPADQVLPVALGYAERIAANAPLAVRATKELVRLAVTDADRAAARLGELQATVWASHDAAEGARAFAEKRPPVWLGR
jgi:enoyl-CoA hydratase/carnithine racemase